MRIARPVAAALLAAAFVIVLWYGISARWGEPFTAVGAWGIAPS
jgi:hypothetical protein